MYSIVNSFWDEVTDVSVRVTMKGDDLFMDEDTLLADLIDTYAIDDLDFDDLD